MSDPTQRVGIEQEALVLQQDLEVRRFIRRTYKPKVAENLLSIHTALCELAASVGSMEGEWDQRDIAGVACKSEEIVSHSLLLLEQAGLVDILKRRSDKGFRMKPVIRVKNIPREVLKPIPKNWNRPESLYPYSRNRGIGSTTTGSGEDAEMPQDDFAHNKVGFKVLRSKPKSSAGGNGSPAHDSASPKVAEEPKPKPEKYFMLPDAQEDWGLPWGHAHGGAAVYWAGKEVALWGQFRKCGLDRGMRKLMIACYLADRSAWTLENKHPLAGLVKNGPRYQLLAEEYLRRLDKVAEVAARVTEARPELAVKRTRQEFESDQVERRRWGLDPEPEPLDFGV